MLESDEVTLIRTHDGADISALKMPLPEVILHFTAQLEWGQWYAVVINQKLIMVGKLEGSLS
jgi:hypothetical protein